MFVAILSLVICSAAASKERWESNNDLVITLDLLDANLAHTLKDADDTQKRAFSIIAEATLLYVTRSADPHDVVQEMHDFLDEPADVIAADPRKDLTYVKSLIAQPINDIKRACKEHTTRVACVDILEYYIHHQIEKCPEYISHVQLRDNLENLFLDQDLQQYIQKSIAVSRKINHDVSAIGFFLENLAEYEHVFDRLREMFKEVSTKKYPCRSFGPYDAVHSISRFHNVFHD